MGSKMFITAHDIITGERHQIVVPSSSDLIVPVVSEKEYVFVDLDRETHMIAVLNDEGEEIHFKVENLAAYNRFIETLNQYENSGDQRTLKVTTYCSMGLEGPKTLQVQDDEEVEEK